MANYLDNLADYLEDESVGTVGTDIFVGVLPDSPDNCVALLGLSGMPTNADIKELEFPRFQALIRNTNYSTGADKMAAVRSALHVLIGEQLANYRVLRCHAWQEGGSIGQDDKGRYEFSINFEAEVMAQNAPSP